MNAVSAFEHTPGTTDGDFDMIIVGAGLSGIGMAVHLMTKCPGKSFAILEQRANLGGTWDLFRYPGVRSDSDMHTLGFEFEPWTHEKSIADAPAILDYLNRIVDERGIRGKIRFGHKVLTADFDSAAARWTLAVEGPSGTPQTLRANFVYLGSGYYDYDSPYDAGFAGRDEFAGRIVHPQFWPDDLDYAGKRVVVIGSGATAATIVPAMAKDAAHVTMLQRTPTWFGARPAKDKFANTLRKYLPERVAYAVTRAKNIRMQNFFFKLARRKPEKVKAALTKQTMAHLGDKYDAATFTPPYNPWDQRLCLIPDADLFEAIKQDRAAIVTGHIEAFDATGIKLTNGEHVDADVIVTATGLTMTFAGKIAFAVDGVPVDFSKTYFYRNCMFSNLPNVAGIFGYLNASWTLRVDIVANYLCRLINHMDAIGAQIALPVMAPGTEPSEDNIFDFSSGYIQRGMHIMPKNAPALPWRLNQDYIRDRKDMRSAPVEDGVLKFSRAKTAGATARELEEAQ